MNQRPFISTQLNIFDENRCVFSPSMIAGQPVMISQEQNRKTCDSLTTAIASNQPRIESCTYGIPFGNYPNQPQVWTGPLHAQKQGVPGGVAFNFSQPNYNCPPSCFPTAYNPPPPPCPQIIGCQNRTPQSICMDFGKFGMEAMLFQDRCRKQCHGFTYDKQVGTSEQIIFPKCNTCCCGVQSPTLTAEQKEEIFHKIDEGDMKSQLKICRYDQLGRRKCLCFPKPDANKYGSAKNLVIGERKEKSCKDFDIVDQAVREADAEAYLCCDCLDKWKKENENKKPACLKKLYECPDKTSKEVIFCFCGKTLEITETKESVSKTDAKIEQTIPKSQKSNSQEPSSEILKQINEMKKSKREILKTTQDFDKMAEGFSQQLDRDIDEYREKLTTSDRKQKKKLINKREYEYVFDMNKFLANQEVNQSELIEASVNITDTTTKNENKKVEKEKKIQFVDADSLGMQTFPNESDKSETETNEMKLIDSEAFKKFELNPPADIYTTLKQAEGTNTETDNNSGLEDNQQKTNQKETKIEYLEENFKPITDEPVTSGTSKKQPVDNAVVGSRESKSYVDHNTLENTDSADKNNRVCLCKEYGERLTKNLQQQIEGTQQRSSFKNEKALPDTLDGSSNSNDEGRRAQIKNSELKNSSQQVEISASTSNYNSEIEYTRKTEKNKEDEIMQKENAVQHSFRGIDRQSQAEKQDALSDENGNISENNNSMGIETGGLISTSSKKNQEENEKIDSSTSAESKQNKPSALTKQLSDKNEEMEYVSENSVISKASKEVPENDEKSNFCIGDDSCRKILKFIQDQTKDEVEEPRRTSSEEMNFCSCCDCNYIHDEVCRRKEISNTKPRIIDCTTREGNFFSNVYSNIAEKAANLMRYFYRFRSPCSSSTPPFHENPSIIPKRHHCESNCYNRRIERYNLGLGRTTKICPCRMDTNRFCGKTCYDSDINRWYSCCEGFSKDQKIVEITFRETAERRTIRLENNCRNSRYHVIYE